MARYYVNRNARDNGDHEVHMIGCQWMPDEEDRIFLGDFGTCSPAVEAARQHYDQVDGCPACAYACHTE